MPMQHAIEFLALAACGAGAITDIRSKRIPNALTLSAAVVALALHAMLGPVSLAKAALVMVVVLAAGIAVFRLKLIGGGDVKLVAAIAGAFGFPDAVPFVLYTMVAGGVLAIAYALSRGTLRQTVQNTLVATQPLLYRRLPVALPATTEKMPYGLAIFIGASFVVLSHAYAPFLRFPV
ncbi:MAG TPA: prepilin peptidase [Candidatus Baltobacteraceae bacterium]